MEKLYSSKRIAEHLREMAKEHNIAIITATQVPRENDELPPLNSRPYIDMPIISIIDHTQLIKPEND